MKQITYIETAEELVNGFSSGRCYSGNPTLIPAEIKLFVSAMGDLELIGEGADLFQLDPKITFEDVVDAMSKELSVPLDVEH